MTLMRTSKDLNVLNINICYIDKLLDRKFASSVDSSMNNIIERIGGVKIERQFFLVRQGGIFFWQAAHYSH